MLRVRLLKSRSPSPIVLLKYLISTQALMLCAVCAVKGYCCVQTSCVLYLYLLGIQVVQCEPLANLCALIQTHYSVGLLCAFSACVFVLWRM